jgi:uncharacterized protein (DUF169 family)
MPDYRMIEEKIRKAAGGARRPVAIAFAESPPEGVAKCEGSEPASCGFWRLAAEGRVFYTVPEDHFNCPIGGYTHAVLPAERMPELQESVALMTGIGYIRMEEIPGIYRLPEAPGVAIYAPLGETPAPPDAVLIAGKPARVMLLVEAARRAGAMSNLPPLGRPACMAIPAALANGAVTSSGCAGNRVYTGIGDEEMYIVLRGADLERVAAEIDGILSANQTLTRYHEERRGRLTAGAARQ